MDFPARLPLPNLPTLAAVCHSALSSKLTAFRPGRSVLPVLVACIACLRARYSDQADHFDARIEYRGIAYVRYCVFCIAYSIAYMAIAFLDDRCARNSTPLRT